MEIKRIIIPIHSISDIITNSSSETFLVRGENIKEASYVIIDIIKDVCTAATFDSLDVCSFGDDENGNLIIESVDDNSIPYFLEIFITWNLQGILEEKGFKIEIEQLPR